MTLASPFCYGPTGEMSPLIPAADDVIGRDSQNNEEPRMSRSEAAGLAGRDLEVLGD
jgi:hypothetical protein